MKAIEIIQDAYERCNRLSPGEVLSADDAAFGLRRLNLLVDELSASDLFLYKTSLTSAPQTGSIVLGADPWSAINPGDLIVTAQADNITLAPITMQQYAGIYAPATVGMPQLYAMDGLRTVYLWPIPNGQTIKLQTRNTAAQFADQLTDYTLPNGWRAALGAGLAVRIAPNILGKLPPELLRAERQCMASVANYEPDIINVSSFTKGSGYYPPRLF